MMTRIFKITLDVKIPPAHSSAKEKKKTYK
jgi:hypothetical protein